MANKMLIDATHPEETRVVVLRGNRVEEFDFEAANRKQLRGNIYLAKVTRVEPSLQAAFVDYGGNRHGFLAFSEIHPDYYQIPVADRQALLEEERLRHSSDDDFEPADDEADFQEIDETDEEDFDDGEQPEEEAKPRRSRSGRGRTSRGRGGRDKNKATAGDDGAATDAVSADGDQDSPDAVTKDEPPLAGADQSDAPEPEAAAETSETSQASEASGDNDAAPADPEQSGKIVPDRFLAASDDDDAVLSGDLPVEAKKKPSDSEAAGTEDTASQEAAENTPEGDSDSEVSSAEMPSDDEAAIAESTGSDDDPQSEVTTDAIEEKQTDSAEVPESEDVAGTDVAVDTVEEEPAADLEAAPETVAEEDVKAAPAKPARSQRNNDATPSRPRRRYKIQEVIKRRQIILVQVVKEERGTKGAALTTYLSLAGRYSVLMPNSARGGGISRKITNPGDRKRLKQIANELPVPEGMGVILRTAGASRTKTEVKRDFEYLMRLWENVRDLTLQSSAPALVYEEGNLVKRSIRDLYNKDIDEVLVAGDTGYREAKDFMRMLMPSHAKNVQPYKDQVPIFAKNRVEPQLDAMFLPRVTLPSGGYIIINQTEALVAVDVNSGKATREHNIEDTALRTNVEAAEEMARQLRLRDLAGLIVIDFIDMEEKRNNRTVERKLKDCLKSDRARIQVGRISHFGLLEMSRQRLRTGVLESSTELCPHCHGTGVIRSTESVALHVLRSIEDQLLRSSAHNLNVRIRTEVALYIINNKRHSLTDMEDRYGVQLNLAADETIEEAYCIIDRDGVAESRRVPSNQGPDIVQPDTIDPDQMPDESAEAGESSQQDEGDADGAPKKRRRKRRRRGKDSEANDREEQSGDGKTEDETAAAEGSSDSDQDADGDSKDDGTGKKRRRGRRGGRRNKRTDGETSAQNDGNQGETADDAGNADVSSAPAPADENAEASEIVAASEESTGDEIPSSIVEETPIPDEAVSTEPLVEAAPVTPTPAAMKTEAPHDDDDRPKKSGWWQKRSFFKSS